jgi:transcriptional regulator with XRE-family HTH domain
MKTNATETYLRAWRKFRGLTLEEAAERAELSHSQLSRIERGQSDYTKTTLEALAAVYDCSPGDLVSKDPTEQVAEVVDIWSRISTEKREQARQILETFATDKRKA